MKNLFPATHGKSGTKLYRKWTSMKTRCSNPNATGYSYYGGKGVSVCEEWKADFMSFYNWAMESGYKEGLTIERIDNNGKYEPSNCEWLTMKEQNQHKSNCRIITVNGVAKSQQEWADQIGISEVYIITARHKGKNVEKYIEERLAT